MQEQEVIRNQVSETGDVREPSIPAPETPSEATFNTGDAHAQAAETAAFMPDADEALTITAKRHEIFIPEDGPNAPPAEDGLFSNYEIKSWDWTPRLYKIFAASAVINIAFLFTFAQTNILRAKACDSPLVGGFCQVLDTLYVTSVLSTDNELASLPYEGTKINDADIVWIDQTGIEPPLEYPAGYFQIANPEDYLQTEDMMVNPDGTGFPSTVTPMPMPNDITPSPNPTLPSTSPNNQGVLGRKQTLPRSNRNAVPKNLPTIDDLLKPEDETKNPTVADNKNNNKDNNNAANSDDKNATKQPGLNTVPLANDVINKKPFEDFGQEVLEKVNKKEVDLSKEFAVTMVGTITDEGKFDPKRSAYLKSTGDEQMVNVAKSAIEAIGDSQILKYLKDLDVNQIKFELVQNDKEIYVVITSDQPTEQKAKSVASGFNTILSVGKMTVKKEETDTHALLDASKVESRGKSFVLNFKLDKPVAQEMIRRQLEKAEAKRKEAELAKPSSTAQTVNKNANTGK